MDSKSGDRMKIKKDCRAMISKAFNAAIIVFVGVGIYAMLTFKGSGTGLTSQGWENLKYFTVLSNIFCGIVALLWLILDIFFNKKLPILPKLMAASAVGLTFAIIAFFLAPMYPDLDMYQGGNRYFHLIVPLIAMVEFLFLETKKKIPFKYAIWSAALALVYGMGYLINILVNGIGVWPETNDWYGFLNWGFPAGMVIFAVIVLMDFGAACLMRFLNHLVNKLINNIFKR